MDFPVRISDTGDHRKSTDYASYVIRSKDLSYKLSDKTRVGGGGTRYILKNVNCEARSGEITAIAGPSGAGKTTLLEILAGVVEPNEVTGRVLVNDQPMNAKSFRRISGYVSQDEALFPLLTVEETFMYSARLRLKGAFEKSGCRVKELLKELGLEHVSGSRIGSSNGSNRGISGGEKRRVSIGVDLVHDPSVLLIDEPTSGLDSASALHLALLLKSMAMNQGKTIVLTIHQPGFRILEQFDRIVLLSNGSVRHHGSLNRLEDRLKSEGHSVPRHVNVLEFAIDVAESLLIDTSLKDNDVENHVPIHRFPQIRSNPVIVLPTAVDQPSSPSRFTYPNSRIGEIFILGQRFASNIFRTKQLFLARTLQSLLAGLVLGTIFMNAMNDQNRLKLQTQVGFFAFSLTFLLTSTTEGLPIFLQERKILMRETSRGAYRVSSYVLANTIIFLPFLLTVSLLYTTPVYFLVGLRRELGAFCYFALIVWLVVLMSNSFVACFSALVPNYIMGTSLIAGIMGSFFLFSGYFISKNDIPRYWIFMHYSSLFKYPFECFMINEFGGDRKTERCLQTIGGQCVLDGDGFLRQQGLERPQMWSNLMVMVGFIVGYRFLCFLILWFRSSRPSR